MSNNHINLWVESRKGAGMTFQEVLFYQDENMKEAKPVIRFGTDYIEVNPNFYENVKIGEWEGVINFVIDAQKSIRNENWKVRK
jgi:hypothetical protein